MLEHPLLVSIARAQRRSVAQVCLRWCVQHGVVPLVKSSNPERMRENTGISDFEFSANEMAQIDALDDFGSTGLDPDSVEF